MPTSARHTPRRAATAALALILASTPLLAQAPAPPGDPFADARVVVLDNGLTVVMRALHSDPVVAVQMYYRAGARNETTGITGIAHFVEHMLFRGTENFGLADVTGVIERAGGEWHGYTWLDGTTYFEAAPRDLLPTLLRLEAERMTRARMAPDEVDPERGAVFQEYRGYQLDPRSDLFDAVMAILFQQHPYRNNTMGWESDLSGITHADLVAFYRRYYGPRNAVLAIAGDFDPERTERDVRALFGALPAGGEDTSIRTVEPPLEGTRRVTLVRPGAASAIVVSFLAPPPARAREYASLMILDTILTRARGLSFYHHSDDQTTGGGVDPSSRFAPLTRTGPASGIGTAFVPTIYPGHYSIYASPRPGRSLTEVESAIADALAQAAQTITDDEVARARGRIAAADSVEVDAPLEVAHEMAFWTALGGAGARGAVMEAVGTVSATEVRAVAAGLTPAHAAIGMLLPPAFTPELAAEDGVTAGGRAPAGGGGAALRGVAPFVPPTRVARRHGVAEQPPERAHKRQVVTRRLSVDGGDGGLAGAASIVDMRPDLGTFTLRLALAPAAAGPLGEHVTARLEAAAHALAGDERAREGAAVAGCTLTAIAPGEGRFDERDTFQVELSGPASAWDAAQSSLESAIARALRATPEETGAESPSIPDALALSRLDAAMRAASADPGAGGDGGGAARGAAGGSVGPAGVRLAAALVAPYAASAVTPRLESLANIVGAAVRGWSSHAAAGAAKERGASMSAADTRSRSTAAPGAAPFAAGRQVMNLPRIPQGRLLLAIAGDADGAAQEAVAWLLHHNYSGRLGAKAIAETGLVYDMDSESARRGPPLVVFTMGADPGELPRLETALGEVLDGARGGFTEAEVAGYRTYAAGRAVVRLAHPDQAARLWTSVLLRGGDDRTPAREAERAALLTPEAVAAAAGRMLAADRRLVVVVGREEETRGAAGSE
jgi:zinc protease